MIDNKQPESMRDRVARELEEVSEAYRRAAVDPYSILRVSARRYSVIARVSVSTVYMGVPDVAEYSVVFTGKLQDAAQELARRRAERKEREARQPSPGIFKQLAHPTRQA